MVAQEAALGWWDAMVAAAGGRAASALRAAQYPLAGLDLPRRAIEKATPGRSGNDPAVLPVAEANALLGRLYTQEFCPAQYRATHGIFYTPPILVRRLLLRGRNGGGTTGLHCAWVIDPACGAGAFLVQCTERNGSGDVADAEPAIALSGIASRLKGCWDLDPFAAWLAQISTEAVEAVASSHLQRTQIAASGGGDRCAGSVRRVG